MWHKFCLTFSLVSLAIGLALVLGGCTAAPNEETGMVTLTATPDAPSAVVEAREAVLDYLRDGANECVPPAGIRWQAVPGMAPDGFNVFRFRAEDCLMTVSYPLDEGDETEYHVTLGDKVTGFCWQATVDVRGLVQDTGLEAQMREELVNAAAAYCTDQGYLYETRTQPDGRECGACVFPDQSACNAWAFFQQECQPGDIPLTEEAVQE